MKINSCKENKLLLKQVLNPASLVLQATGLTFQRHFSRTSLSRTGSDLGWELSTIAIAKSRKTYSSDQMQKCSWKTNIFPLARRGKPNPREIEKWKNFLHFYSSTKNIFEIISNAKCFRWKVCSLRMESLLHFTSPQRTLTNYLFWLPREYQRKTQILAVTLVPGCFQFLYYQGQVT